MPETAELTAEDRGIRPEATQPPQTPEVSLVAPTGTTVETTPNPERDGWEKTGVHAILLLDRTEIPKTDEGLSRQDKKRLAAIANGEIPPSKQADAAAADICNKYWKGKDTDEAWQDWAESLDAFLNKQKGTPNEEFFQKMGFTIEAGGAETIRARYLERKNGKLVFKEDSMGQFAHDIVNNNDNDPNEIRKNMGSIKKMAKLYGDEGKAIESVLERIQALNNLRSEPERFIESAELEMAMDEDMPGTETLRWIKEHSGQWNEDIKAREKEIEEEKPVRKAVSKAKGSAVDDEKRNEIMAKQDQGLPLDTESKDAEALLAGEIRIANLDLKDETGKSMDHTEVFRRVLERLGNDDEVADISKKIEGWVIHESRHYEVAKDLLGKKNLGNVSIVIHLSKGSDGKYIVHPETEYEEVKRLPEEEQKNIIWKVMTAPGLGKDGHDHAGMSRDDLYAVHLYEHEKNSDGSLKIDQENKIVGHPIEAVKKAREYINDPARQDEITAFINSRAGSALTEEQRAQTERDICLQIAFKLKEKQEHKEDWQINLEELYQ